MQPSYFSGMTLAAFGVLVVSIFGLAIFLKMN